MKKWMIAAGLMLLPTLATAEVIATSPQQLQQLQQQNAVLIDIRRADEWQRSGMIAGSHGVTFFDGAGQYDIQAWLAEYRQRVKAGQPVVLICRSGRRTAAIGRMLEAHGIAQVYHLSGGIRGWLQAGQPLVPVK